MKREAFYVFYDRNDFVRCCGTAKQLVASGCFKNVNSVQASAVHIKQGIRMGAVAILVGEGDGEIYRAYHGHKTRKGKL